MEKTPRSRPARRFGCKQPPTHLLALIHDVSRITHDRLHSELPELQRSCRLIMMHLAHNDNVTQLDLVHATHLKPPTVSVSLQKMELNGLVSRRSDDNDLRVTRVSLTEKGCELDRSIIEKIQARERELEACLTEDEKATLIRLLEKLHKNLTQGDESLEEN